MYRFFSLGVRIAVAGLLVWLVLAPHQLTEGAHTGLGEVSVNSSVCNQHQFTCNSGQCIPELFRCDLVPECDDKSDEDLIVCSKVKCLKPSHQFRCTSGQCLPSAWRCDGYFDCEDRSDEISCQNKTSMPKPVRKKAIK